MDFEKKYNDLLGHVKEFHARFSNLSNIRTEMEECIPELKESKEDKIKNYLIKCVKATIAPTFEQEGLNKEEIIAWLEKHDGAPIIEWTEEDERIRKSIIRYCENEIENLRNDKIRHSEITSDLIEGFEEKVEWLENLKRTKVVLKNGELWKPTERQIDAVTNVACAFPLSAKEYKTIIKEVTSLVKDLKAIRENG